MKTNSPTTPDIAPAASTIVGDVEAARSRSASCLHPRLWLSVWGRAACRVWPLSRHHGWVRRTFRHWCLDEDLVVETKAGFRMAASPANYVSYGIYFYGEYDPLMTEALTRLARPGQTVWDVGTERGWFSCLLAKLVGPGGRVDAFEAWPANAARLRRNLALNHMHWVRANQVAVSDRPGEALFQLPTEEVTRDNLLPGNCSGVGYLTTLESADTIRVPTIALDDYAEANDVRALALIKLDIEGAETRAIRGAWRTLQRHRPIVAVEYNRLALRRAGASWEELDRLFEELDYDRFVYQSGQFATFSLGDWDQVPDHRAAFNVYAFPRERGLVSAGRLIDA